MKKLLSLMLILTLIFSLCGCIQETTDASITTEDEILTVGKPMIIVEEKTEISSPVVYHTETGEKYHTESCLHLKSKIETTVDEARSMGLRPCSVCQPPQ